MSATQRKKLFFIIVFLLMFLDPAIQVDQNNLNELLRRAALNTRYDLKCGI